MFYLKLLSNPFNTFLKVEIMNSNVAKLPLAMQQLFLSLDKDILESITIPSYALPEGVRGKAPQQGSFGNGQAIGKIVGTPLTQVVNMQDAIDEKNNSTTGGYETFLKEIRIESYMDDVAIMSEAVNPLELVKDSDDIALIDYDSESCEYREAEKSTNELAFMNALVASWNGSIGNLDKDGPNLKEFRKGFDSLV